MTEISEEEWRIAIIEMKQKREEIIKDRTIDFTELLDNEIIIKLLESGLKLTQDEKNNI